MSEHQDEAESQKMSGQRPQTSTRDLTDTQRRLERWLARQLPAGASPQLSALEVPGSTGMSSETLLFDANWDEGGVTQTRSLVARVAPDPAAVPVFRVYDLDRQFQVMRLVAERTSVPVPRTYWLETDCAALGVPFFVMERVQGQVPPDIMPYVFGSWLRDATLDEQRRLQDATVRVLAELHAIVRPEETFAFLSIAGPGPTPLRRHVADQWSFYQWIGDGLRVPLIERCFAWMEDHWPKDEEPTVLSWGDARIGNVMYRDFEPVAVLDWEMAALGPREMDLGWLIYLHRFYEDMAAQFGQPSMPHFLRRDEVVATYQSLTGYTPHDLDFYTMYSALRHGIIMARIKRRAIRFGEATMPEDADDLIMHRATLEEMIAGTYWDRVNSAR